MSSKTPPETVITLRLPSTRSGIQRRGQGTLLIQRGDLAHIQQFSYTDWGSVQAMLRQAEMTLTGLEIDPPKTPSSAARSVENPPEATTSTPATEAGTTPMPTGGDQDRDVAQPSAATTSEQPAVGNTTTEPVAAPPPTDEASVSQAADPPATGTSATSSDSNPTAAGSAADPLMPFTQQLTMF